SNSKGIIGALRYLENNGVNSVYFLPLNYGGDGCDTAPFISDEANSFARTHYDLSKLHQWDQVLHFAQKRGVLLHFVLRETESGNESLLGPINALTVQRKLFYRELVARFGSYYATKWNISEESDLTDQALIENKDYLRYLLPYNSPISFHTHGVQDEYDQNLNQTKLIMGSDLSFGETSIQYHNHDQASDIVEELSSLLPTTSISMDENGTPGAGVTNNNIDDMRKRLLYDVLFSGGQIEWYMGYHALPLGGDMRLEDFGTREQLWQQTAHARRFMESFLPFWEMEPADELLTGESNQYGGGEVFAKRGSVYAIYLPDASQEAVLDLSDGDGTFIAGYYNPRSGQFDSEITSLPGGGYVTLPEPPDPAEDWVILVAKRD
ncbi:MAG: hypothetical protein KDD55_00945, partial [Bdellovibrionales bacterium]|nr:hypothetical protein [Bdellovibrionales bacterium]